MTLYLIACCHTQPISIDKQGTVLNISDKNNIFNMTIIKSIQNVIESNAPPCYHDNITTSHFSTDEPCAEIIGQLRCPGNFFEIVRSSPPLETPIFLRRVFELPSNKCKKENNVCLGCKLKVTRCETQFEEWKTLVQLDSNLTTIIKKFKPKTGKMCRCSFKI